jgi:hypothetical protein
MTIASKADPTMSTTSPATGPLITESRFPDPDRAFRRLIEARRGLSPDQAAALDARLVLLLANHIGDEAVLAAAIAMAQAAMPKA